MPDEPTPAEDAAAFAPWSIPAAECTHCQDGLILEERDPSPEEYERGIRVVRNVYACGYCTAGPSAKAEWDRTHTPTGGPTAGEDEGKH